MPHTIDLLKLPGALDAAIALTSAENVDAALATEVQADLLQSAQSANC